MFLLTTWALRAFGMTGIIGSILFILGDLYYNHIPGSKDSPAVKLSTLPGRRLVNAGTLGLLGCWLYTFASLHLYLAFRPAGDVFAFILLLACAATGISYGIGNSAYFAIAAGAQAAVQLGSEAESGGKLGNAFFHRVTLLAYLPGALFSVMMLYGIVTGQSLYPRWMVVFLPIVLYLLKIPVTRVLRGRLREIVNDSYDNIVWLVFYLLSTVVLWNGVVV